MSNLSPKTGIDKNGHQYTRMVNDQPQSVNRVSILDYRKPTPVASNDELNERVAAKDVVKGEVVEYAVTSSVYDIKAWATAYTGTKESRVEELEKAIGGSVFFSIERDALLWRKPVTQTGEVSSLDDVLNTMDVALNLGDADYNFNVQVAAIDSAPDTEDEFRLPAADYNEFFAQGGANSLTKLIGIDTDEGYQDFLALTEENTASEVAAVIFDLDNGGGNRLAKAFDELPEEYKVTATGYGGNAVDYNIVLKAGDPLDWDNDSKLVALDRFVTDYVQAETGIPRN
jgi:hypothetical protein